MKVYEVRGCIEKTDCVIGHSFGSSVDGGSVNHALAILMLEHAAGRPMIADRTLVDALPDGDNRMAHVVEGQRTNMKAEGVGTWGTLVAAKEYMDEYGLKSPLMIAQAYHISRVVRQAGKLGITSIAVSYTHLTLPTSDLV